MEEPHYDPEMEVEVLKAKIEILERDNERLKARDQMSRNFIEATNIGGHFYKPKEDIDKITADVARLYTKGQHLEIIQTAIQQNPLMQEAWDKVMMTLRLCGYDEPIN